MTLYRVVQSLVAVLAKLLFRLRIVGADRIPRTGPYVFAPSHRSLLDTPFVAATTRRRVRYMGKEELWKVPVLGPIFTALGGFPVDRHDPKKAAAALRQAVEVVKSGDPVVIFPEGTRREGDRICDLHDGAAYVAARQQVPIVPVGIAGSEQILARGQRFPRLRRVTLVVGEPIEAPRRDRAVRRDDVRQLTAELEVALQKVFDEARALLNG